VLSLNFLVCARPTSVVSGPNDLATRDGSPDKVATLLVALGAEVGVSTKDLGRHLDVSEKYRREI
jgi:hypothetical protein